MTVNDIEVDLAALAAIDDADVDANQLCIHANYVVFRNFFWR